MTIRKEFHNAEEFRRFLEENFSGADKLYVKEIYNSGEDKYCESPLFIYSGYSIIMAYLSEGVLSVNIYEKDLFIRSIRGGIFRGEPDSREFYYVNFTSSELINSFAEEINIKERDDGKIDSLELIFKNGQHLHIENSSSKAGTMCSFLSD